MFGLLQPGGDPDLAHEPLRTQPLGELRRKQLDDHFPPERGFLSEEDARHAATAELMLERVGAGERCGQLVAEVRHGA